MRLTNPTLLLTALLAAAPLSAAEPTADSVREALAKHIPSLKVGEIKPAPMAGLFEVSVGPKLLYVSGDGRYLMEGALYDLEKRENLTELHTMKTRREVLAALGEEQMLVYAPKGETKHTVTIFTDIDCPYCRKLHGEMADYNAAGIKVRYLLYPRAGVGSPSYEKSVSVWCAEDRNGALDRAKGGKEIESKSCDNPVNDHMKLGNIVGVTGTPAIVTESGELLPGYIPAKRLAAALAEQ